MYFRIDNGNQLCHDVLSDQAIANTGEPAGGDRMDEMTTPELNQFLEAIAELIEAKANTVSEAAEIVRQKEIPA